MMPLSEIDQAVPVRAVTQHSFELPGVSVELRSYSHERSAGPRANSSRDILGFFSSRTPPIGVRRVGQNSHFSRLGRTVLLPRDATWEFDNPGVPLTALVCAFDRPVVLASEFDRTAGSEYDLKCSHLSRILSLMVDELRAPKLGGQVVLESLWISAEVFLRRCLAGRDAQSHAPVVPLTSWQLRKVEQRLQDHAQPPPTVAELAQMCQVSRQHLSASFQLLKGRPLGKHIAKLQMDRAKFLLRETNLPIKQIAFQLGFSSASNFGAAFKRSVCVTPKTFRST